jgi:hypothetical protein
VPIDAGRKRELQDKVHAGERLSYDDGVALYDTETWRGWARSRTACVQR